MAFPSSEAPEAFFPFARSGKMLRSSKVLICALVLGWSCASWAMSVGAAEFASLKVVPEKVELRSPEASQQVIVFGTDAAGNTVDITRQVTARFGTSGIAAISAAGRITPEKDGQTVLTVEAGGKSLAVAIDVTGVASPTPVSFRQEVIPILSKAGCNSGGCHGKAEGQNGFKLSVFGYDVAGDHYALVSEGRGRRIFPASPDNSLLLLKATGIMPHGGGQKVEPGSHWYALLRRWINEGAILDPESEQPAITKLVVEPAEITLAAGGSQQLLVSAIDSQGKARCVTMEAGFQSNNEVIAGVDGEGLILATDIPGEAAILVRYLGHVAVCRVTRPHKAQNFVRPAENNFIDKHVWDKLAKLQVPPSNAADDATFLRRVYLDTIGTLPTAGEARQFLENGAADKRQKLIAELLQRPEYADFWAQRWSDLLQVDKDLVTPQGAVAMSRWVRKQIQNNVPYDQFVHSILTAQGSTLQESPAAFFQVQSDPEKSARAVSQLFLGVRIECAQCHHHPFERWDQQDYFALAGFFTGLDRKPALQGSIKLVNKPGEDLKHPRTGKVMKTAPLGVAPVEIAAIGDRRKPLADWATHSSNPYFTRTIVNRLWAHYMGRGLVEPLDDLRATNPATNEPLLEALAQQLIALRYDVKAFTKTLLESQTYQLSSQATDFNRMDEQNYSHAAWKPISAEVLLDAISQATAVPEDFNGWPKGYRAIQIWDNKLPSHFLEVFGRPTRQTVCACERGTEPSIAQALHLMNSPITIQKVQDGEGYAAKLAGSDLSPKQIVEELYLTTLSRLPTEAESQLMQQQINATDNRREACEDILWTLLNLKEFVFNH